MLLIFQLLLTAIVPLQLMATGVRGPVGRPALSLAAEERGIEGGCATHLRLQRTEDSALAPTTR